MSHISRRDFLLGASALLAAPRIGLARKRLPVLGVLAPGRKPPPNNPTSLLFRQHLRELGWVDGKTLRI